LVPLALAPAPFLLLSCVAGVTAPRILSLLGPAAQYASLILAGRPAASSDAGRDTKAEERAELEAAIGRILPTL
jgi:hypothetical protein